MPPKRGKGKVAEPDPSTLVPVAQRPATPNDFQIVATVRTLQGLVNTESKWKNRLLEAQYLNSITGAKMEKLEAMVAKCQEGIQQLEKEVEEIIAGVVFGDTKNPMGTVAPQNAAPPAAAPPKPAAGKKGAPVEVNIMEHLPPQILEARKEQAEALGNILRAYFSLPKLAKESVQGHTRPPIQSPEAMRKEMEEARRLSTPTAELMSQAQERALSTAPTPSKGAAAARQRGSLKGKLKEPANATIDESIGDLNPTDFLPLPCPRGVDSRIMSRIITLRSRRIRLEHCIETFRKEMIPLQKRDQGVTDLLSLGNYSLNAVQPKIQTVIEEEVHLQKVQQQENDAWMAKQRANMPPPPPEKPSRR